MGRPGSIPSSLLRQQKSEVVLGKVIKELSEIWEQLDKEGNQSSSGPNQSQTFQFGKLSETIRVAQEIPGSMPCIDISHLHAGKAEG